jgi:hypothetical protein
MRLMNLAAVGLVGLSVCAMPAWVCAQTAVEAPASTPERQAEIKKLIADLSSPDEATRTSAMQKLVTMGADAQQALQDHIRSRDAAQEALQQIEVNKVAGPTLVTLDVKDAPIRDVLEQLSKQTGYKIQPYNDSGFDQANLPNITLSVKDQPFWQVMREVMNKGEVAVYESGNNDDIMRMMPQRNMGRSMSNAPVSLNGAFMVLATNIQRNNSVDLSNPDNVQRSMSLQLQVYSEPKVNVLRYSYQPEIEEAVDDKGNSMANKQNSHGGYSSGRQSVWSVGIPLVYPDSPGSKIARLKGKIRMTVQTRSDKFEVSNLLETKDKTEKVGGRRVTFVSAKRNNNNQYAVKVVLYRDGMDQQAFYDMMNNPSGVRLLDKDGKVWRYSGSGSGSSSGDRYEREMIFYNNRGGDEANAPGEPVTFVWELPTGTQEITIPFEFSNLPLP